jgi:hypothetical protein
MAEDTEGRQGEREPGEPGSAVDLWQELTAQPDVVPAEEPAGPVRSAAQIWHGLVQRAGENGPHDELSSGPEDTVHGMGSVSIRTVLIA